MPWLKFDATFSPGSDVVIIVKMDYYPYRLTDSFCSFGYILESGAGWYGKIGYGKITINLPYTINEKNYQGYWNSSAPLQTTSSAQSVEYEFTDLEPSSKNNLVFLVGVPYNWQQIDHFQEMIKADPNKDLTYIQLGQIYYTIAMGGSMSTDEDVVDPDFVNLAIEAYEQALAINPYHREAHFGIAKIIWDSIDWYGQDQFDLHEPRFSRMLEHLSKAIALSPQDTTTRELLWEIEDQALDGDVPLPTVDPSWLPTKAPTQIIPTNTERPIATKTKSTTKTLYQTFTPQPKSGSATPVLFMNTAIISKTQSVQQQPPAQTRLVLYLILIGLMAGAGFVMWRRDQR